MGEGKLTKLEITGYKTSDYTELVNGDHTFQTLVNPESIKLSYSIEYEKKQAEGTSLVNPKFSKATPPTLTVKFLFDGTGVFPNSRNITDNQGNITKTINLDVSDRLNHFKKIVYDYNGNEHKPNHLVVSWGTMRFKGVMESLEYDYKLFNRDGSPLRVIATCKFYGALEEELRAAKENNSSPDLTHIRQVVEGDTLPLMSKRIYGDPKYYLEVAKANNLTNFRKLTPGQEIYFPPIEKLA